MQKMQEMQVQSLAQENPLEKEMATHSSILAWEVLWTEEPGRLQSMGLQEESDTTYQLNHELLSCYLVVLVLYGNYIKGYNSLSRIVTVGS